MSDFLRTLLDLLNETLAAGIVVISASLLLYNLTRNLQNRVARTSAIVLGCVTVVYMGDVLVSLHPGPGTYEALLRFQWLGLAFIPAAVFHLSDSLLATTGLPSRGRRRRVIRILYAVALMFFILAAFTDYLIEPVAIRRAISLRAGALFWVFCAYFVAVNAVAFGNVQRARLRCRTRSTQRRMGYLQGAMLTPVIGIFPYSLLLPLGEEFSIRALILVNIANGVVISMLVFLAYPLSFFGSQIPDRLVKTELLRFMLRGPATGLLALVVILFTNPTTEVLGIPGDFFMPFAAVAVILLWQWMIALALPWLERRLIYRDDEDNPLDKVQQLYERSLSRTDLIQLMETILAAICDYLRVNVAFAASYIEDKPELVQVIGGAVLSGNQLENAFDAVRSSPNPRSAAPFNLQEWENFWIIPLYSKRILDEDSRSSTIGILGIEARSKDINLTDDEMTMLRSYIRRAAQSIDDLIVMAEIYASLEGLLPQFALTRSRTAEVEYLPGRDPLTPINGTLERDQIIEQVRAALRHYWGGPGLTRSRLLELTVVQNMANREAMPPVRALREVLLKAIEQQRPQGPRDLRSPEWTLYNILDQRFLERHKARETAQRLYMSEANLFRKQNVAIEAVADTLIKMEYEAQQEVDLPLA